MLKFDRGDGHFGFVVRPVRSHQSWPQDESSKTLAGPAILDVYREMVAEDRDSLVQDLVDGATVAGVCLVGHDEAQTEELRRAFWRSAHRFIIENIHLIDRSPELQELARILKMKL